MGMFLQLGGILAPKDRVSEATEGLKPVLPGALDGIGFYSGAEDRVLVLFDDYADATDEAVSAISARLDCPAKLGIPYPPDE